MPLMNLKPTEGRQRVFISNLYPEIEAGRFPIKRVVGDLVLIQADLFADSHDMVSGVVRYKSAQEREWRETPLELINNDRWRASFSVTDLGRYQYTALAWVDHFRSWSRDLQKKHKARLDLSLEMLEGAALVTDAASRAKGEGAAQLKTFAQTLSDKKQRMEDRVALALDPALAELMTQWSNRAYAFAYPRELEIIVDPRLAESGAWYELFPRSTSLEAGKHGTFADVERQLPRIAAMGFDVLYLPPVHPIGRQFRKGPNNNPVATSQDHGSPWAIGSEEGGHKSVLPALGTLADFDRLVKAALDHKLSIAMDIAFQCAPDHPYVKTHPEWFKHRPDGTIQYAENPPKKYQDIYPFDFETTDWQALWDELKSVFEFWIGHGVTIFRVDNPHTKAFRFWEWCISAIKAEHPEVIFLAEAFTRPKVMYHLAKLGFTQSYNYFPWRNTRLELTEYLTELTQTDVGSTSGQIFGPTRRISFRNFSSMVAVPGS